MDDESLKELKEAIRSDAGHTADQIDNLYESASNYHCSCAERESSCHYCDEWEAARGKSARLITDLLCLWVASYEKDKSRPAAPAQLSIDNSDNQDKDDS